MKKIAVLFMFFALSVPPESAYASIAFKGDEMVTEKFSWYSFEELKDDFITDTKEVAFKNIKTGFFYDFLEKEFPDRHKFGVSTSLIAWKFLAVDPIFIYTPSNSRQIGEGGISFPIRLGRIPVGNGKTLSDFAGYRQSTFDPELIDRIYLGLYMSQNLSTGRFGFGWTAGFKW